MKPKIQVSSHSLSLYSRIVSDLVGNPEDRFSHLAAHLICSSGSLQDYIYCRYLVSFDLVIIIKEFNF